MEHTQPPFKEHQPYELSDLLHDVKLEPHLVEVHCRYYSSNLLLRIMQAFEETLNMPPRPKPEDLVNPFLEKTPPSIHSILREYTVGLYTQHQKQENHETTRNDARKRTHDQRLRYALGHAAVLSLGVGAAAYFGRDPVLACAAFVGGYALCPYFNSWLFSRQAQPESNSIDALITRSNNSLFIPFLQSIHPLTKLVEEYCQPPLRGLIN